MVSLCILLVEKLRFLAKDNKKVFRLWLEHTLILLGSFTKHCTGTVIQVADKCGIVKLLLDVLQTNQAMTFATGTL